MNFFRKLFGSKRKTASILIVGLDNSGKTTLVQRLKHPEMVPEVVPTVGYSVDTFNHGNISFRVFDMSGQGRYRKLWQEYYSDTTGIIFVIDSADKLRMVVAKDEFEQMLNHGAFKNRRVPVLILANKMDLDESLSASKVADLFELDKIRDKPYYICGTNAKSGKGLTDGIDWLSDYV